MSYSFVARFDTTSLSLDRLVKALFHVLENHKIYSTGSLIQLVSHNNWPTVENLSFQSVESHEIANVASSWWGVGLYCVSQNLIEHLGKNDAGEVEFSIFKGQKTKSRCIIPKEVHHSIAVFIHKC